MKLLSLLMLLVLLPSAFAAVEIPVDEKDELCGVVETAVTPLWCLLRSSVDSSNKLSSADLESGVEDSDTVRDVETAIVEKDIELSKERVAKSWGTILSLVLLLVEVVRVVFYIVQLFVLVHVPFFYVKLLVFVKEKAFAVARGRRSR